MRANPFRRLKMLIFFILNYGRDTSDLRSAQRIIRSGGGKKIPRELATKENEVFYVTHPMKRTHYVNTFATGYVIINCCII